MRLLGETKLGGVAGMILLSATAFTGAAQAEPFCDTREVVIYFDKDQAAVNKGSKALVQKLAKAVQSCEGAQVVADAPQGGLQSPRAAALTSAFSEMGVKVLLVNGSSRKPMAYDKADPVVQRGASVRIVVAPGVS